MNATQGMIKGWNISSKSYILLENKIDTFCLKNFVTSWIKLSHGTVIKLTVSTIEIKGAV